MPLGWGCVAVQDTGLKSNRCSAPTHTGNLSTGIDSQKLFVYRRLEQEVWSNSLVVASFYGPVHSTSWWMAAIVSTAIPAFYCFTGGMRASLFTDVFQVWRRGACDCVCGWGVCGWGGGVRCMRVCVCGGGGGGKKKKKIGGAGDMFVVFGMNCA